MKRGIAVVLAIMSLGGIQAFATPESADTESFLPVLILAQAASTDAVQEIPRSLRNNRYFTESLRMSNLARLAYNEGDYDKSAEYAQEAVEYARQSDDYITLQLKIRETNNAITLARRQLDQTALSGIPNSYPDEYSQAREYYNSSVAYRNAEDYDQALEAANRVGPILASLQTPTSPVVVTAPEPEPVLVAAPPVPVETTPPPPAAPTFPAQYTVRSWELWRDCLWNIAGQSWAYGDPTRWRVIYEANRAKFPQPDNPDLIDPGMVLDIPSIRGENRQGMWNDRTEYPSLR